MHYWDTSALLKLYVAEVDSDYFLELLARSSKSFLTAEITKVEVLGALYRKERTGALKRGGGEAVFAQFMTDIALGRILVLPYGSEIFAEVHRLVKLAHEAEPPLMLRSLDALHLATAVAGKAKVMVATDTRLRDAARLAGLEVLPE